MRAVLTRVLSASVEIGGRTAGAIDKGFLVLLGVHEDDTEAEAKKIADETIRYYQKHGSGEDIREMESLRKMLREKLDETRPVIRQVKLDGRTFSFWRVASLKIISDHIKSSY